jgi:hypothetical protein
MPPFRLQPRRPWTVALLALAMTVLAGCNEDTMPAHDSEAIIEQLLAFTQQGPNGATIRLDSVTDFTWDTVYGFNGTAPMDFVNRAVGQDVSLSDEVKSASSSDSALLIFLEDGQVVHQMAVGPGIDRASLFIVDPLGKAYTPETAVLAVHTKDPGPYVALRFQD